MARAPALRHLHGLVGHQQRVGDPDTCGQVAASHDALELRVHVVVGHDPHVLLAHQRVELGHRGIGIQRGRLGLGEAALGADARGTNQKRWKGLVGGHRLLVSLGAQDEAGRADQSGFFPGSRPKVFMARPSSSPQRSSGRGFDSSGSAATS